MEMMDIGKKRCGRTWQVEVHETVRLLDVRLQLKPAERHSESKFRGVRKIWVPHVVVAHTLWCFGYGGLITLTLLVMTWQMPQS